MDEIFSAELHHKSLSGGKGSHAFFRDLILSGAFQRLWQVPQTNRGVTKYQSHGSRCTMTACMLPIMKSSRLRCYFAGCRALGVRDRHELLSDAALPDPKGVVRRTHATL